MSCRWPQPVRLVWPMILSPLGRFLRHYRHLSTQPVRMFLQNRRNHHENP
jgi:hypothetical protein